MVTVDGRLYHRRIKTQVVKSDSSVVDLTQGWLEGKDSRRSRRNAKWLLKLAFLYVFAQFSKFLLQ